MAQHQRIPQDGFARRAVQPVVEVGTADPSKLDRHEGLILREGWLLEEIDSEVAASMGDDGADACCCLHSLCSLG
ncbi:hypothetical protein SAT01_38830 [Sinomonas atrocyanea]|nr:hypothetical protein SAT01_38830 [Sinomonas atrocyanea]GGG72508.1 hypothetical protein GCM10007172_26250 [Sinomonas atrocyanea]